MATHFSVLAWKMPWMEQPGGLQSMGSQKEWDTTEVTRHAYAQPFIKQYVCTSSNRKSQVGLLERSGGL